MSLSSYKEQKKVTLHSEHRPLTDLKEHLRTGPGKATESYRAQEAVRVIPRLLNEGTMALRSAIIAGATTPDGFFLFPRELGEETEEFRRRVGRGTLFPALKDAAEDIVGRVFAKPLDISDAHPRVQQVLENVDREGRGIDVFLQRVALEAVVEGISWVFVNYPSSTPKSHQEEIEKGIQPYWMHIKARYVIEAMPTVVDGNVVLSRTRFIVPTYEPDGDWGQRRAYKLRAIFRGDPELPEGDDDRWAQHKAWTWDEDEDEWIEDFPGTRPIVNQVEIPMFPFYAGQTGPFEAEPSLLDLALLNLQHFQKKTDLDNALHLFNMMALLAAGFNVDEVKEQLEVLHWGPYRVLVAEAADARIDVVEHSGHAVEGAHNDLDRHERMMASAAMQPFVDRPTGEELAAASKREEKRADNRAQSWAVQWAHSATEVLKATARFIGIGGDEAGVVKVTKDVFHGLRHPAGFDKVLRLYQLGAIKEETLLKAAKLYNILWHDFSVQDEIEALERVAGEDRAGLRRLFGRNVPPELENVNYGGEDTVNRDRVPGA